MIFNNEIDHLKLWCQSKAREYETGSGHYGGVAHIVCSFVYELEFKLSMLTDNSFQDTDDLKKKISELLNVHYEPCLQTPPNNAGKHMVEKVSGEFCAYSDEVMHKSGDLPPVDIPYSRVIVGDEAGALRDRFLTVWSYVNTSYWFPLMGEEPKEISDKFFIMLGNLEPYMERLQRLIGLPRTHIYSYGEIAFRPEYCLETVELTEYGGCETIYTDKDFSWAIYFSHEDTVAFAGTIVPTVKEMLSGEKEHWNVFEWDLD